MANKLSLDQVRCSLFQDDPEEFGLSDGDTSEEEGGGLAAYSGNIEIETEEISGLSREVGGSRVSRFSGSDEDEEGLCSSSEVDSTLDDTSGK